MQSTEIMFAFVDVALSVIAGLQFLITALLFTVLNHFHVLAAAPY